MLFWDPDWRKNSPYFEHAFLIGEGRQMVSYVLPFKAYFQKRHILHLTGQSKSYGSADIIGEKSGPGGGVGPEGRGSDYSNK